MALQEQGKQALTPTPGSSPAGELPLLPPLLRVLVTAGSGSRDIGVSLQHVHGKQGPFVQAPLLVLLPDHPSTDGNGFLCVTTSDLSL